MIQLTIENGKEYKMNDSDRVKLMLYNTGDLRRVFLWIVSRKHAIDVKTNFEVGIDSNLHIEGVFDDSDANPIKSTVKMENVGAVEIMEINSF